MKKTKKSKEEISGFGTLKGMRSFTKEDEFNSCLDKFYKEKRTKKEK